MALVRELPEGTEQDDGSVSRKSEAWGQMVREEWLKQFEWHDKSYQEQKDFLSDLQQEWQEGQEMMALEEKGISLDRERGAQEEME